jgi:hypothetical protein
MGFGDACRQKCDRERNRPDQVFGFVSDFTTGKTREKEGKEMLGNESIMKTSIGSRSVEKAIQVGLGLMNNVLCTIEGFLRGPGVSVCPRCFGSHSRASRCPYCGHIYQ